MKQSNDETQGNYLCVFNKWVKSNKGYKITVFVT